MKAVCSSVCHNLNTTRYSYILPALPPTKKCTPTSAVMPWVVTSEQAHKQCWTRKKACLMCIESPPPFRLTCSLSAAPMSCLDLSGHAVQLHSCLLCRGQEQHIRYEHIYLQESSGQPEVEYAEIKRPRLEITPEALMRPSSHRQPLSLGPAEDMAKVRLTYSLNVLLFHSFSFFVVNEISE